LREDEGVKEKRNDVGKKDERKGEEYAERVAEEGSASPKQQERTSRKTMPPSEPGSPTTSPTQRKGRSGRSNSDSDASHHKKASVMNMVKGEMKILLGKASRSKGKVEEGEKLKSGSD
jgi:hypothetical protein